MSTLSTRSLRLAFSPPVSRRFGCRQWSSPSSVRLWSSPSRVRLHSTTEDNHQQPSKPSHKQHPTTTTTTATNKNAKPCWNCGIFVPNKQLLCPATDCQRVQPLDPHVTYFDILLESKWTFRVDARQLRRRFLELQQKCHPDNWGLGTAAAHGNGGKAVDGEPLVAQPAEDPSPERLVTEKQMADTQSSWLNKAYHTLKDPLARSVYLLNLLGRFVTEQERLADFESELLMQIMELRERIDSAEALTEVEQIAEENQKTIDELVETLAHVYDRVLSQPKSAEMSLLDEAKRLTVRLKYFYGIQDACKEWAISK